MQAPRPDKARQAGADNWLHVALTAAALLIGLISAGLLSSARRTDREA